MKKSLSEKLTVLSIKLSKIIKISMPVYYIFLIIYDLFVYKRDGSEIIITYLETIMICLIAYFMFYLMFWLQIKNRYCSEKLFNISIVIFLLLFGVGGCGVLISYLLENFNITSFVIPLILLSVLRAQKQRNKNL